MSESGWGAAPEHVPQYGALPPGTGRTERLRLIGLGISCALPLPLVLLLLILYAAASGVDPADRVAGIAVGLLGVVVIGFQVVTPIVARSSILGDHVHKPGIARGKLVMTLFGVPVMSVAVLLAVMESAFGLGVGFPGALLLLLIGFLGLLPRHRLRKIESVATAPRP